MSLRREGLIPVVCFSTGEEEEEHFTRCLWHQVRPGAHAEAGPVQTADAQDEGPEEEEGRRGRRRPGRTRPQSVQGGELSPSPANEPSQAAGRVRDDQEETTLTCSSSSSAPSDHHTSPRRSSLLNKLQQNQFLAPGAESLAASTQTFISSRCSPTVIIQMCAGVFCHCVHVSCQTRRLSVLDFVKLDI